MRFQIHTGGLRFLSLAGVSLVRVSADPFGSCAFTVSGITPKS